MKSRKNPQIRRKDILTNQMADETLLYDLENDKAFCLNETSGRIWNLCDGTRSPAQVAEEMGAQADVEVSERIVLDGIAQFAKKGLLEDNGYRAPSPRGFSRRDLIQKAAVALPVVYAMAAPSPAQAQTTCIDPFEECIPGVPPDCCPGLICIPPNGGDGPGPAICIPLPPEQE